MLRLGVRHHLLGRGLLGGHRLDRLLRRRQRRVGIGHPLLRRLNHRRVGPLLGFHLGGLRLLHRRGRLDHRRLSGLQPLDLRRQGLLLLRHLRRQAGNRPLGIGVRLLGRLRQLLLVGDLLLNGRDLRRRRRHRRLGRRRVGLGQLQSGRDRRRVRLQIADLPPGRPLEDLHRAGPITHQHHPASLVERSLQPQVGNRRQRQLLGAVLIPDLGHPVATGRNQPAVTQEVHRSRPATVRPPRLDLRPVGHLPQPDGRVFARTRQHIAVDPPVHRGHHRPVPIQHVELAPRVRLPDHQPVAAVTRRQQHPIGAELHRRDPVGVLLHLVLQLTVSGRVNPHHLPRSTQRDLAVVRADVGPQYHLGLAPNLKDPVPRLHVEDHHPARLPTPAPRCQQQ